MHEHAQEIKGAQEREGTMGTQTLAESLPIT
jgi:hypothetical protein